MTSTYWSSLGSNGSFLHYLYLFVSICCLLHLLMGCHVFTLSGLRSVPDDLHPIAVLPARPEDHTDGRGQPAMARLK